MVGPNPQLLTRDQPVSSGLTDWGDALVARTHPLFRTVDVEHGSSAPLILPDGAQARGLATFRGRPVALVTRADRSVRLVQRDRGGGGWKELPLPPGATLDPDVAIHFAAAADGATLVLWTANRLFRLVDDRWTVRPTDAPSLNGKPGAKGGARCVLLADDRLYVGFNSGEWGGGLVSLDTKSPTATWQREGEPELDTPVTGLTRDARGHVWVTRGQPHLGAAVGLLHERDESGRWKLIAASQGKWGNTTTLPAGDWNLPMTSFDGLAFDDRDRLYVVTGELGLVRREAGAGWSRLTPTWPGFVYVDGLVVSHGTAVIGTYDSGVLLFDLATGRMRRVTL